MVFPSREVVERHSIPVHLLERLNDRIEEAGKSSADYPRELSAFIRRSLLIYFDVSRLVYLRGQTEYNEASFLAGLCGRCFQHNNFDPSWAEDGYISFPVRNSTGTRDLRHPRMMDFPRHPRKGDLELIQLYNEYIAEASRPLLPPPSCLALPAPTVPLERKETTVTSVIASVATFGGEVSGGVEHRAGKPYLTLTIPANGVPAFWKHVQAAEEEVAARIR